MHVKNLSTTLLNMLDSSDPINKHFLIYEARPTNSCPFCAVLKPKDLSTSNVQRFFLYYSRINVDSFTPIAQRLWFVTNFSSTLYCPTDHIKHQRQNFMTYLQFFSLLFEVFTGMANSLLVVFHPFFIHFLESHSIKFKGFFKTSKTCLISSRS